MIQFSETGKVELIKAFVAAQSEMDAVYKNATNPAFKSKYADLASVMEAVMPALSKNGLALMQSASFEDDVVSVETMILHTSGGSASTVLSAKPQNATPQGIGSVQTYLRRYSLMAITGVAPEDDDGNAGNISGGAKPNKQQPAQKQVAPVLEHAPSEAFKLAKAQVEIKKTTDELGAWWNEQKATFKTLMSEQDYAVLIRAVTERRDALTAAATQSNDAPNPFEDAA